MTPTCSLNPRHMLPSRALTMRGCSRRARYMYVMNISLEKIGLIGTSALLQNLPSKLCFMSSVQNSQGYVIFERRFLQSEMYSSHVQNPLCVLGTFPSSLVRRYSLEGFSAFSNCDRDFAIFPLKQIFSLDYKTFSCVRATTCK